MANPIISAVANPTNVQPGGSSTITATTSHPDDEDIVIEITGTVQGTGESATVEVNITKATIVEVYGVIRPPGTGSLVQTGPRTFVYTAD